MTNNRLIYKVFLKVLTALGIVTLMLVFINSLFVRSPEKALALVELDISGMKKGEIKKTYWAGRPVAVLYRSYPISEEYQSVLKAEFKTLNPAYRSIQREYFVFMDKGDSGNCPLFYRADVFKDTCTGNTFNNTGRMIGKRIENQQNYEIKIPPHHFSDSQIVFGSW